MRDKTLPIPSKWYVPDTEMITSFEIDGKVPVPLAQRYVVSQKDWEKFTPLLNETYEAVYRAFSGDLVEKIEPYKSSLPVQGEAPQVYFHRISRKCKVSQPYEKTLSTLYGEVNAGRDFRDTMNSISLAIPAGERTIDTDVKIIEIPDVRTRIRECSQLEEYSISFSVGVNQKREWFYGFALDNDRHAGVFDSLNRTLRSMDSFKLLTELRSTWRAPNSKHDTNVRIYGP